MSSDDSPSGRDWVQLASSRGVSLRATGSGPPVLAFPGMEGTGDSCLQLMLPTLFDAHTDVPRQLVLVDYAKEQHRDLADLVDTITRLITAAVRLTDEVVWWGQSFGNLLLALTCGRVPTAQRRLVLVSPFTELPSWRVTAAAAVLRVTPRFVYAATAEPVGRFVFGPAPRGTGRAFFAAMRDATPVDVRRRVSWLRGTAFPEPFRELPGPLGVWFGARDRLVDLAQQRAFFAALTRRPGDRLSLIPGSGHVVLPPDSVATACAELRSWLADG
jgi:pimeloyl-ACP methyl ester carboxylesterase